MNVKNSVFLKFCSQRILKCYMLLPNNLYKITIKEGGQKMGKSEIRVVMLISSMVILIGLLGCSFKTDKNEDDNSS